MQARINDLEWLGRWEDMEPPAKHDIRYPADGARGYQYWPSYTGSRRPDPWNVAPTMWDRVNRAIPVEGTVGDVPSWHKSPQARFWLEKKKPSLRERVRAWLNRDCIPCQQR